MKEEMERYTTQEEAIKFLRSCAKQFMTNEQIGRRTLSERLNISQSVVNKLINGQHIGWTAIKIIADFFGYKITSIGCVLADKNGNPVAFGHEKNRKI